MARRPGADPYDGKGWALKYQPSLFDDGVMQDRSARLGGRVRLPVLTRGDCEQYIDGRIDGLQCCAFINCRYHLIGEVLRLPDDRAAGALARYMSGQNRHTCVLDAAADAVTDEQIGHLMGIDPARVPQRVAEAAFKMRRAMAAALAPSPGG